MNFEIAIVVLYAKTKRKEHRYLLINIQFDQKNYFCYWNQLHNKEQRLFIANDVKLLKLYSFMPNT